MEPLSDSNCRCGGGGGGDGRRKVKKGTAAWPPQESRLPSASSLSLSLIMSLQCTAEKWVGKKLSHGTAENT